MKNSISTIASLILMILFSFQSIAKPQVDPLKSFTPTQIVKTYLETTIQGDTQLFKYLFTEDFQYQNNNSEKVFNKKEYADFTKANKGLKYDCETSYEIIEQYGNSCLSKVTMKFEKFTRVDYVTLSLHKAAWKVNKIVTTYP